MTAVHFQPLHSHTQNQQHQPRQHRPGPLSKSTLPSQAQEFIEDQTEAEDSHIRPSQEYGRMAMTETTESAVARHHIRTALTHPHQRANEYHLVAHLASKLPPHYPSTAGNSTALIERQDSNSSSSTAGDPVEAARRAVAFQGTLLESYARPRTAPGTNGTSTPVSVRAVPFRDSEGEEEEVAEDSGKPKRPISHLQRARSDFGPRSQDAAKASGNKADDEGTWRMRHGWEDQYSSEEYLSLLTSAFYMYYTDKRHETGGNPKDESQTLPLQEWRMKDRLKTVSAALAICLNIGVDPPDVIKTTPCAKLECWVDTTIHPGPKAMELIGKNLQQQYETLSIRTRYKQYLDPSVEETKKFACSLRRNAKDERVLFHYNGHGVPKPTASGEIWVFNKNYTQYIPISLYDLQAWLGAPSLFVYDCSDAGNIIRNFNRFVEKHEAENAELRRADPNAQVPNYGDCIQLAACGRKETLPTNPDLPADLFTCCLTTPIEIALRFFVLQNPLPSKLTIDDVLKLPGRLQERRTPMGELNWIFTAITDTIAWNTLPRALFKKLFRQDLMVAALFRNFLLSQRIMRVHQCHPQSWPELPETHHHPLWESWDLAVEMVLAQLPALIENQEGKRVYEYQHSTFFTEQLTAFEVYLTQGAVTQKPPDQLPIVLQVLLSQVHRLRALILLSKFLDLGPWAVNLALSIGIFPYVLKLLQSAAQELKPVMVFIWARILAVDQSCQTDLLKDNGYSYFVQILSPTSGIPIANASEHRAMCAFIIAMFCKGFHQGQVVCMGPVVIGACLAHLGDVDNPLLRQWACLCISQLWVDFPEAKWVGIRESANQRLCDLALDPVPEVRAAMLYALNNFLGIPDVTDQVAQIEESIASTVLIMTTDGSNMVRKELLVFFSTFVKRYENKFMVAAYEQILEEKEFIRNPPRDDGSERRMGLHYTKQTSRVVTNGHKKGNTNGISYETIFAAVWKHLLLMSVDPHPEISRDAGIIIDYIYNSLLQSPLGRPTQSIIDEIVRLSSRPLSLKAATSEPTNDPKKPESPAPTPSKQNGYLSLGLKRTASIAASLKNLAIGSPTTPAPSASPRGPRTPGRYPGTPNARVPAEWNRPPDQNDHYTSPGYYQPAKVPTSRHFKPRDTKRYPELPLQSKFLDWSIEYFREPQMKPSEADEPGSTDYNQRLWRRTRNERIIAMTQPEKEQAGSSRWDNASGFFNNGTQPSKMCFHQFENHLVVSDDRDNICVWDWSAQVRLCRFSNSNPMGSRINEIKFINEDDQALLITGSSDGVVKVYRNYESERSVEVVSAWRALTDLVPSNVNAGLAFDWQQGQGKLLVAGDVKVIRVWNAATEICTNDIPARSGSCITSLTSDQVAGNVFAAGFGDGAVRVYDQRLPPRDAMFKVWKHHKQWITNVHMQRGGLRELVSGCRNGDVMLWDIRMDLPLRTIRATRDTLRSLSVHEHAPVFATGSGHHNVKVFNVNGGFLSSLEPYSSFLQQNRQLAELQDLLSVRTERFGLTIRTHNIEAIEAMGKNKKRKCNTTHTVSSGGDGHDRSKRQRPSTADGDCGFAGMAHPRVDPLTGQHGAFPGLDDDDPDELFYGPANDGLDYLRMVRSEAKEVPQLLVAPKEDENDDIYGPGVGDSRGFYEDGAYTAAPILGPMPPNDLGQKSPMEIYLDRLILRFKLHRANLRCIPPAGAVQALSKDHPISCEPTRASYSRWHRLLRATDPLPVQLSAMDQVAALRLIRLITQNGFLKRNKIFDSRVSRWIWSLLGRIEDVGVMGSQDVGIIRDLGKRAVWVVEGLMERRQRDAGVDVEEIESGELDGGVEEYMDTDETKEEGGVLSGDNFEPTLGRGHTIYTPATDSATAMPKGEELEEGEISDSPEEPTVDTAADELEAAKTRLMARVSAAERNDTVANGDNGSENVGREEVLTGGEEYWERVSNVRGTLNMIITVVGELYGQRDLLKHRDLLWELAD